MVDLSQVQSLIGVSVAIGTGVASFIVALLVKLLKVMKTQTTNGDTRTLRNAVDDLAQDFKEHRYEMREEISDVKERVRALERSNSNGNHD
ncbi:MAG TPA: hypothetical protein VGN17_26080 [Bryobacteraceae bacterium]|jgi:hypothetical protein